MKPQKAYICLKTDEYTGGVVFARDKRQATRIGASNFANGEPEYLEVRRAKNLDKYAETGVPAFVLVLGGWHFECHGCGMRIDDYNLSDAGLHVEGVVGFEGRAIYCCHVCRCESKARAAENEAFGEAFCDMLRDMVQRRFPEIAHNFEKYPSHHYVPHSKCVIHAMIKFDFPGQSHGPAYLEYHHAGKTGSAMIGPVRPEYWCCSGDMAAFKAISSEASQ